MGRGSAGIVDQAALHDLIDRVEDPWMRAALFFRVVIGMPADDVLSALKKPRRKPRLSFRTIEPPSERPEPPAVPPHLAQRIAPEGVVCWDCMKQPVKVAGAQCRFCRRNETKRVNRMLEGRSYSDRWHRENTAPITDRNRALEVEQLAYQRWQDAQET